MRPSSCVLIALLVVIALACIAPQVEAHREREILLNVGGKPPKSLARASVDVLHGLPRADGANDTLGRVNPDDEGDVEAARKYAYGVILPIAICFSLAALTWLVCAGFCLSRSCLNTCGSRTATRTYTQKDQRWLKAGIVLLGCVAIVLFGLGLVSNAAISARLDDAYVKCDVLVEHMYQIHNPLESIMLSTNEALATVQTLNRTVLSQLPQNMTEYRACATLMYETMEEEKRLLALIEPVAGTGSTSDVNLTQLAVDMRGFAPILASFPDLSTDSQDLQDYESSLSTNLPTPVTSASYEPSRDMLAARTSGVAAADTADALTNSLTPALDATAPTITPVSNGLASYVSSDATVSQSQLTSLVTHLDEDDRSASTVSEVNDLNDAMSALPDKDTFLASVTSFQAAVGPLRTHTAASLANVSALLEAIDAVDDGQAFNDLVSALISNVASITHAPGLVANLRSTDATLTELGTKTSGLLYSIDASVASVASLRANASSDDSELAQSIHTIFDALPQLQCIRPIFTQLLKLNSTVLVFPPRMVGVLDRRKSVTVQLQRILRIQHELNTSLSSLQDVATSLDDFPDLTPIRDGLADLNTAVQAFSDCDAAADQIEQMDAAFAALTNDAGYLANVQSGVGDFVTALNTARTDVFNVHTLLTSLKASLDAVPADLSPWTTYANSVDAARAAMASNLALAVAAVNDPSFATNGMTASLRSAFAPQVSAFQALRDGAPDHATLQTDLSTLAGDITAMQGGQATIANTLTTLQGAADTFPDVTLIATAMEEANEGMTQAPLAPLMTGTPHSALDTAVSNVPSMTSEADAVDATVAGTKTHTGPLVLLAADLEAAKDFMSAEDMEELESGLDALDSLLESFPDLASPIDSLGIASSGLIKAEDTVQEYRHRYWVARQDTVVFKNHIDWLRLLGYMLILFVPLCVAACGAWAWIKRSPVLSLYMGMCSFSLAAIFFAMTAVHLAPALLFADQCQDIDGFLRANFSPYGLSANATMPWVNMSGPLEAADVFDWFRACEGTKPPLIDVFAEPQVVLAQNQINFTDYKVQVANSIRDSGDVIQLKPNVWNYFVQLDNNVQSVIGASGDAHRFLSDCETSAAAWMPLRDSVCSETMGVSGAIALSTCVCFLFAICMLPGVCVGIIGYKRFDPANFGTGHLGEKIHFSEGDEVEDPYAAGLAERPLASPSAGGHAIASPSHHDQRVSSPSLAMAPVDAGSIELQERRPSTRSHHLVVRGGANEQTRGAKRASPSASPPRGAVGSGRQHLSTPQHQPVHRSSVSQQGATHSQQAYEVPPPPPPFGNHEAPPPPPPPEEEEGGGTGVVYEYE